MKADLTAPVEAAARAAFDQQRAETAESTKIDIEKYAPWDGIGPVAQNQWRQIVLPIVQAAVDAIPEPVGPGSDLWLQSLINPPSDHD